MEIIISVLAVLVAFSCLAALLFSDIKERRARVAAKRELADAGSPADGVPDRR